MNGTRWLTMGLVALGLVLIAGCGDDTDDQQIPVTLAAQIDATTEIIPVFNGTALPERGVVQINQERLSYTGRSATALTGVRRGVDGTVPGVHAANSRLIFIGGEVPTQPPPTQPPPTEPPPTEPPPTNTVPPTATLPVGDTPTNTPIVDTPTPGEDTPTPVVTPTPTPTVDEPDPTPTEAPVEAICGNGIVEEGEECDDGNTFGGDGCAANCTIETPEGRIQCNIGGASGASVQTSIFRVGLSLEGRQIFTAGKARDTEVITTDEGRAFLPGEIPMIMTPEDIQLEPVAVPGLVCACVRGELRPEFGPDNAADGRATCNDDGMDGVDVLFVVDHDIRDRDPDCLTGDLEGPEDQHPGACNADPASVDFTGEGPRGSMVITIHASISLIPDGGLCIGGDPELFGPDGLPCTDDDPDQEHPRDLISTTGRAEGIALKANFVPAARIEAGLQCGGAACVTGSQGSPIPDCDQFLADPNQGVVGLKLVNAFGAIDSENLGDNVTVATFECVQ